MKEVENNLSAVGAGIPETELDEDSKQVVVKVAG